MPSRRPRTARYRASFTVSSRWVVDRNRARAHPADRCAQCKTVQFTFVGNILQKPRHLGVRRQQCHQRETALPSQPTARCLQIGCFKRLLLKIDPKDFILLLCGRKPFWSAASAGKNPSPKAANSKVYDLRHRGCSRCPPDQGRTSRRYSTI